MRLAIARAAEGMEKGQLPFGAVVVREGRVVGSAHNTIFADASIIEHAETNAIREACRRLGRLDLSGCTIYASCEPCPMCFGAAVLANVARVVYSARLDDGFIPGFSMLPITNLELKRAGNASIEVVGEVLRDEGAGVFRAWREKQAGIPG